MFHKTRSSAHKNFCGPLVMFFMQMRDAEEKPARGWKWGKSKPRPSVLHAPPYMASFPPSSSHLYASCRRDAARMRHKSDRWSQTFVYNSHSNDVDLFFFLQKSGNRSFTTKNTEINCFSRFD